MALVETYEGFVNLYEIPYSIVVILYLIAKYVAITAVLVQRCCNCTSNSCWSKFAKPWRKFTSWLIRILFGGTEGVSESESGLDVDEEGIGKVYINGRLVEEENLDLLGAIVACFLMLLLLTMYSTYLLETTFECSENPALYCFAQLPEESSSNIVIDQNKRIENCSYFNDLATSLPVSINCFRYALNAKEALAVGGGLLAIFTIGMRFLISAVTYIWLKLCDCSRLRRAIQISAFIVLTVFNAAATIILVTFAYIGTTNLLETEDAPVAQNVALYLADNGVQAVIILSTVELLLLLDWDEFEPKDKNERMPNVDTSGFNGEVKETQMYM